MSACLGYFVQTPDIQNNLRNYTLSTHVSLMVTQLSITDATAKKIISEQFEKLEDRTFYEEGKQYEDKYFQPQIQTEKRQREARKSKNFNHETA